MLVDSQNYPDIIKNSLFKLWMKINPISIEIAIVEIRKSWYCLISTMGFPVLVRQ